MKTTRYRTATLVGDGVKFSAGASAQFEVTIVIQIVSLVQVEESIRFSGRMRQAQEPVIYGAEAACATNAEEWPSAEARRQVFKPTHELMCEGLPQPEI